MYDYEHIKCIREDKNLLKNFYGDCFGYTGITNLKDVFTRMIREQYDVHNFDILITKRELRKFGKEVYTELTISIRLYNSYKQKWGEYTNLISMLDSVMNYWSPEYFDPQHETLFYWTSASGLVHMDRIGNVFKLCPYALDNSSMEGYHEVELYSTLRFKVAKKGDSIPLGSPYYLARDTDNSFTMLLDLFTSPIPYCTVQYVNSCGDIPSKLPDVTRDKLAFLTEARKWWISCGGFAYLIVEENRLNGILFSRKAIKCMEKDRGLLNEG